MRIHIRNTLLFKWMKHYHYDVNDQVLILIAILNDGWINDVQEKTILGSKPTQCYYIIYNNQDFIFL